MVVGSLHGRSLDLIALLQRFQGSSNLTNLSLACPAFHSVSLNGEPLQAATAADKTENLHLLAKVKAFLLLASLLI